MHLHKRQQFRLRRATAHRCFHRAQWASFPHRPQHSSWWFHKWDPKLAQSHSKLVWRLYDIIYGKTDGLDQLCVRKHPVAENCQSQFGRGFNRTDSNQANAGFKSPQYPTIQNGLQNRLSYLTNPLSNTVQFGVPVLRFNGPREWITGSIMFYLCQTGKCRTFCNSDHLENTKTHF